MSQSFYYQDWFKGSSNWGQGQSPYKEEKTWRLRSPSPSRLWSYVEDYDLFECKICRQRYPSRRSVAGHMLRHGIIYNCLICKNGGMPERVFCYTRKGDINEHFHESHPEVIPRKRFDLYEERSTRNNTDVPDKLFDDSQNRYLRYRRTNDEGKFDGGGGGQGYYHDGQSQRQRTTEPMASTSSYMPRQGHCSSGLANYGFSNRGHSRKDYQHPSGARDVQDERCRTRYQHARPRSPNINFYSYEANSHGYSRDYQQQTSHRSGNDDIQNFRGDSWQRQHRRERNGHEDHSIQSANTRQYRPRHSRHQFPARSSQRRDSYQSNITII